MIRILFFLAASFALSGNSLASIGDEDISRGWFFYKEELPVEEKEEEKPVLPEPKPQERSEVAPEEKEEVIRLTVPAQNNDESADGERPGSVEWFKKENERLTKIAIENPTEENILNQIIFQKIWTDKSEKFSKKYVEVYKRYPQLTTGIPTSTAAIHVESQETQKAEKSEFENLKEEVAFFFFFDSKCPYCHAMANGTMSRLMSDGFVVKGVSVDGEGLKNSAVFSQPGSFELASTSQLEQLGVEVVPAVYMMTKEQKMALISVGLTQLADFRDRALFVANDIGVLDEVSYQKTQVAAPRRTFDVDSSEEVSVDSLIQQVKEHLRIKAAREGTQ